MIIAEQIAVAVATLVGQDGKRVFTREEVRHQAGISHEVWKASYSPIFQGMRVDHPGGAPKVATKFQGVFQQVACGKHMLTGYGCMLLREVA